MLLQAPSKRLKTAIAGDVRGISQCDQDLPCVQRKHVEVPGSVLDVQTVNDEVAAVAIVDLAAHDIGKANLLVAQIGPWKRQTALTLCGGVIDDDHVPAALITS